MHANNFTLYQLVKYHIELTEAMEYTLITYKYNEGELTERFKFLKDDFKKGFYHEIVNKLFRKSKKLTREIRDFLKQYNEKKLPILLDTHNLHSRIQYNNKLYLAYAASNNILQVFLKEEEIKNNLEESLIKLVNTTNTHFNLFCLFNSLNLFVSSKVIILQGDSLYNLEDEDRKSLITMLNTLRNNIETKNLPDDILDLVQEKKEFKEEEAYELLNKASIECMKAEKDLYSDFESFTSSLEKEIEKSHN